MAEISFDKKDKENIRKTLDLILDDLREIYIQSGADELKDSFSLPSDYYGNVYNICIKKDCICFCDSDEPGHIILERTKGLIKRPAIKDYQLIYSLLNRYEKIREEIEQEAKRVADDKNQVTERLLELQSKYSRETTIEIDLPETNNQRNIDIKQENGQTIGEFRFGRDTIRIITRGNIIIANHQAEQAKTKKK